MPVNVHYQIKWIGKYSEITKYLTGLSEIGSLLIYRMHYEVKGMIWNQIGHSSFAVTFVKLPTLTPSEQQNT